MNKQDFERYGTISAWQGELKLSEQTIRKNLGGEKGIPGLNAKKRITIFYSETAIRTACFHLLKHPQAGKDGFLTLEKNGEKKILGSCNAWARKFQISDTYIYKHMRDIVGITGRDSGGRVIENGFFEEQQIRVACSEMLSLPLADENGMIRIGTGEKVELYGHVQNWRKFFVVGRKLIEKRITDLPFIRGRLLDGSITNFYSQRLITSCIAESLEQKPRCDEQGFVIINENNSPVKFGHINAWARKLNIHPASLAGRLKGVNTITGLDFQNRPVFLFPEEIIRKKAKTLLSDANRADSSGFIQLEERYGTISAWAAELGISDPAISKRIKESNTKGITGKDRVGHLLVNSFYPESKIKAICKDICQDVPAPDSSGFIVIERDERCATIKTWSHELNISESSIRKRLNGVIGISGKPIRGRFCPNGFFPEKTVREKCKDLLEDLPRTEDGFLIIETVKYGTSSAWGEKLSLSPETIRKKMKDVTSLIGKAPDGHRCILYSEKDVREKCGYLLETIQAAQNGFIVLNNERFAPTRVWYRELKIGYRALSRRVEAVKGITARDGGGRVIENGFLPESKVREACKDLLG